MQLILQTPKKATKAFLMQKTLRSEMDIFKANLIILLDKIRIIEENVRNESEEHLKNDMRDFLLNTFYKDSHAINTKDKKDLVIHLGKKTNSNVGVIIEAKRPSNTSEMISIDNANKKALHEIILYYFREREAGNNELKQLIISNIYEWYIIDANYFDKFIYQNKQIKKIYDIKQNDGKDNPWFYQEIAKALSTANLEIPCVYFNLKDYEQIVRDTNKENDKALSALLRVLSPEYLLKVASLNDSNSLNEKFYRELLHIIGLEEVKEGGKNIIRKKQKNIEYASLIEMTLAKLKVKGVHKIPNLRSYGEKADEQYFNVALELCIVWVNRLLFLKLLEGQLVNYHNKNKDYCFLNKQMMPSFQDLFTLFHEVLAIDIHNRHPRHLDKYKLIPYLNSSLFEISEIEDCSICIGDLENSNPLALISTSVLKDSNPNINALPPLDYLFQFLDAYDFASEGTEEVQEDNKTLINASVLGKVFEKINGYKDGSIFTPAFITMYMCRESIRLAVIEKFNAVLSPKGEKMFDTFEELESYTTNYFKPKDILHLNSIVNDLRICDPAVGSGHFLVSTLNELICIKSDLGILADENGKHLNNYTVKIINDELIITDREVNVIEYKFNKDKKIKIIEAETQRLQKALFHEKQTLIENCLFGVDINPNSVKICRLRLWIELLKNAYYKEESNYLELETLPNLDINIKCGNSLLSRFDLKSDLSKALKSIKYDIKAYKGFVSDYRYEKSREAKRALQQILNNIKADFKTEISKNDSTQLKLNKLSGDLYNMLNQVGMFDLSPKEQKEQKLKQAKLEEEIRKLAKEIEEKKNSTLYNNAFEWRFEFPEVLNEEGDFLGFDVIIANPPYISIKDIPEIHKNSYLQSYEVAEGQFDLYILFVELSKMLVKENGFSSMITSNTFLSNQNFKAFRNYLLSKTTILEIINLDESIFSTAKVDAAILSLQNTVREKYEIKVAKDRISFDERRFSTISSEVFSSFKEKEFKVSLTSFDLTLFKKLEQNRISLGNIAHLNRGIEFGGNSNEIQTKAFSNALPIIVGGDIAKYYIKNISGFCEWKSNKSVFKDFSLHNTERLFIQRIRNLSLKQRLIATYTDKTLLCTNTLRVLTLKQKDVFSLKYLLALINSSLINYYFQLNFLNKDIYAYQLAQIPITEISIEQQKPFIDLVDKILALKEANEDSSALEAQIDALVYDLYELSAEERAIVAGA